MRPELIAPNSRDLTRIALARASSRLALGRARSAFADASLAAFRAEIGATVRHVSPFLLALLDDAGATLDEIVSALTPGAGWPDRPGLPTFLHLPKTIGPSAGPSFGPIDPPGLVVRLPGGAPLRIQVIDQSIEGAVTIGGIEFVSLFGVLVVEVRETPESHAPDIRPGKRLEDQIEIPACLRKGWIVLDIGPSEDMWGVKIAVRTGTRRYRLPWAR